MLVLSHAPDSSIIGVAHAWCDTHISYIALVRVEWEHKVHC